MNQMPKDNVIDLCSSDEEDVKKHSSPKINEDEHKDEHKDEHDDEHDDDADGVHEYGENAEEIISEYPLDLKNISKESLPPVLKALVKVMWALVAKVPDACRIYSLALAQADDQKCPNFMAVLAAAVVLAVQR